MKEPYSELPWKVIKDNTAGLYDKNGDCFLVTGGYYSNVDVDYIIESANNYPKAIELLKEVLEDWNENYKPNETSSYNKACKFLKEIENE